MKLFIGQAIWRNVEVGHFMSMMAFSEYLHDQGVEFDHRVVMGDALVERARGLVATSFYESDADVLLSIDGDIIFQPDQALDMAKLAYGFDHNIIGGFYLTRNSPKPAQMLGEAAIEFSPTANPVKVRNVATGFMAVSRKVVEKVIVHHAIQKQNGFYHLFPTGQGKDYFLSEDYGFCQLAAKAGHSSWIDPRVILRHIGYQYLGPDYGQRVEPS